MSRIPLKLWQRSLLALYDGLWFPVLSGWGLWTLARRSSGWRQNLAERAGLVPKRPKDASRAYWIHAVSVGELFSIRPVLTAIKRREPDSWVLLTVSNPQAYELAVQRGTPADAVSRMPWDSGVCVSWALQRSKPDVLAIVECEIWPNLILQAAKREIPVVMLNARIYERDFSTYRLFRSLFSPLLRSMASIQAQSSGDRERFLEVGADPKRLSVGGNTKFDAVEWKESTSKSESLRREAGIGPGPLWILASTHEDEEQQILEQCRRLFDALPDLRVLIAPRHIQRAGELRTLATSLGYRTHLRSDSANGQSLDSNVVILDTLGELAHLFPAADLVFVGGSLVPRGGHNPIEPAACGKPVLMGPSGYNFSDVIEAFRTDDAIEIVSDARELCDRVETLLSDSVLCEQMGARANAVVRKYRGTADRYVDVLCKQSTHRQAA